MTYVKIIFLSAGIFFLAHAGAHSQTITTYTSVDSWRAAVQGSSVFSQTFKGVTKDGYFQSSPVNTGPFTLQQVGAYPGFGEFQNFIDAPPLQFTDNSGVTNAALYTKFGLVTVNMTFFKPVFAWGANFYGTLSGELENMVLLGPDGENLATVPITVDTGFFGFVLTPSQDVKVISFQSRIDNPTPGVGQGFGLDSVVGACTGGCGTFLLSPSSVHFGSVDVGKSSAPVTITATNNTPDPTSLLGSMGLAGFKFTRGGCSASLAAGASCTFTVAFAPTSPGPADGTITEESSAGPVSLTLTGTGTAETSASMTADEVLKKGGSSPVAAWLTSARSGSTPKSSQVGFPALSDLGR